MPRAVLVRVREDGHGEQGRQGDSHHELHRVEVGERRGDGHRQKRVGTFDSRIDLLRRKEQSHGCAADSEGYRTVTPYLVVKGAADVLEFVKEAFEAEEKFGMDQPTARSATRSS